MKEHGKIDERMTSRFCIESLKSKREKWYLDNYADNTADDNVICCLVHASVMKLFYRLSVAIIKNSRALAVKPIDN